MKECLGKNVAPAKGGSEWISKGGKKNLDTPKRKKPRLFLKEKKVSIVGGEKKRLKPARARKNDTLTSKKRGQDSNERKKRTLSSLREGGESIAGKRKKKEKKKRMILRHRQK